MKKKIIIAICALLIAVIIFFIGFYLILSGPVDKKNKDTILYTIKPGTSLKIVIRDLADDDIVRSYLVTSFIAKKDNLISIQAGTYELNKSMTPEEILTKFNEGSVVIDNVTVTFVEGKRLNYYVKQISNTFGYTEDEIYKVINNEKFLKDLINKYWFINDEILNKDIYYPLEGYLFADTYEFYRDASIETIIAKMIDTMNEKLLPYKDDITSKKLSVHDILAKASIIELEGNSVEDRNTISQVINSRLNNNMSLGMDVTTYYAVKKNMGEELTFKDINTVNPYNTRDDLNMAGLLPVGPICSPSKVSIDAVFNPSETNYLYFYADIDTGKVNFFNDYNSFISYIEGLD